MKWFGFMKPSELLSKRGAWTRYVSARDKNNKPIDPLDPIAVKFCAIGAIEKCYPNSNDDYKRAEVFNKLREIYDSISLWNDNSTKNKVIKVFKEIGY